MFKTKGIAWMLVVFLLAVLIAGCGGQTIKTDQGTINAKDGQVEIKTDEGTSELTVDGGGGLPLPEGYPAEIVPIIDGGKVVVANRSEDNNNKVVYMVIVDADKDVAEVIAFYEQCLKDAPDKQESQLPNMNFIGGTMGEHRVSINIAPAETDGKQKTTVTISIGPKDIGDWESKSP